MTETGRTPARVGIRELRQNLSVYVRRVQAGETLEVTEYGQPVAILAPRPAEPRSVLDQLIAEGRATPAKGDLMALRAPLKPRPGTPTATSVLLAMREQERG